MSRLKTSNLTTVYPFMTEKLFDQLYIALAETDINQKPVLAQQLYDDWQAGKFVLPEASAENIPLVHGVPPRPEIVMGSKVPRRSPASPEGRAALLHAVAHIEYSAIDLALDHAFRFRGLCADYYADWLRVAVDEARHFGLLRHYLQTLGYDYGDFPAHDSLWQMSVRTAHDALARMALVPRLMEARGLDATPPIREKLRQAGDLEAVRILDIILNDEIIHVAIGDRWFRYFCAERNVEPEATYRELIVNYSAPWPQLPMNEKARLAAGFSGKELEYLARRRM
jgi:uncharacterized ferritin-like protein (DUF455 family)